MGMLDYPNGMLAFVGVFGVLFGVGMAATRLLLDPKSVVVSIYEESVKNDVNEHETYLGQLEERLRRDGDDRTGDCLKHLRRLRKRLKKGGLLEDTDGVPFGPEIRNQVEQLYQSCLVALEKSLEFWLAAQEMATRQARQEMLDRREQLVLEVLKGVQHLATTVDHLRAKQLSRDRGERELVQVREELEMGLRVARRVEERIDQLEGGIARGQLDVPA
jgi:hypothetical protein